MVSRQNFFHRAQVLKHMFLRVIPSAIPHRCIGCGYGIALGNFRQLLAEIPALIPKNLIFLLYLRIVEVRRNIVVDVRFVDFPPLVQFGILLSLLLVQE